MPDRTSRDRNRGDNVVEDGGPTIVSTTDMMITLSDAGFKPVTRRARGRVSRRLRPSHCYRGRCQNDECGKVFETASHSVHQTATMLAYDDTCPHCGRAVVDGIVVVEAVEIAAQADIVPMMA